MNSESLAGGGLANVHITMYTVLLGNLSNYEIEDFTV